MADAQVTLTPHSRPSRAGATWDNDPSRQYCLQ